MKVLKNIGLILLGTVILYGGYYSAAHSIDFPTYYRVGEQILRHDFNLYPPELHALGEAKTGLYFRYAPIIAMTFTPFALLNMQAAAFLFYLMKIAALYCMIKLILKSIGNESASLAKTCSITFVITAGFLIEEFRSGNIHFLVFFLIVLALYLIEKGRATLPAFLLGLAIAIKITPLFFLFYFAIKRKFALCLQTLSSVALLFLAPALLLGAQANTILIQQWASSALEQKDASTNHSLKGVLFKYLNENDIDDKKYGRINLANFPRQSVNTAWYALSLGLIIALTVLISKQNTGSERRWLEYCLVITAILLLSPHSTRLYYCTLALPCAVLVILLFKYPGNPYSKTIQVALGICFLTSTLAPVIMPGRKASLAYEAHSPYFFSALVLFFVLSLLVLRFEKNKEVTI